MLGAMAAGAREPKGLPVFFSEAHCNKKGMTLLSAINALRKGKGSGRKSRTAVRLDEIKSIDARALALIRDHKARTGEDDIEALTAYFKKLSEMQRARKEKFDTLAHEIMREEMARHEGKIDGETDESGDDTESLVIEKALRKAGLKDGGRSMKEHEENIIHEIDEARARMIYVASLVNSSAITFEPDDKNDLSTVH